LEKLIALGSDAIDPIVDALATSEKRKRRPMSKRCPA